MRIVAIDSSGLVASVAILENDSILATYSVNYKKNTFADTASDVAGNHANDRI